MPNKIFGPVELKSFHQRNDLDIVSSFDLGNDFFHVSFNLSDPSIIKLPKPARLERKDDLWKQTCFEVFLKLKGENYLELNYSPSFEWNCYAFEKYRSSPQVFPLENKPEYSLMNSQVQIIHSFPSDLCDKIEAINICCVILNIKGEIDYYAIEHGKKPDFHDLKLYQSI